MTWAEPTQSKSWIMAAEGGGFTGLYSTYYILPNGQVFYIEGADSQFKEMDGIGRKEARRQFKNIGRIIDASAGVKHEPGNMNKTLGWHRRDTTIYLMWDFSHEKAAVADEFYRQLLLLISQQNRTGIAP